MASRCRRRRSIPCAAIPIGIAATLLAPVAAAEEPALATAREAPRALPEVSSRAPWQLAARDEDPDAGWTVYKRRLADSDFDAFRLEAVIDAPPALVAAAFRENIADPRVNQRHTTKTVLRDDADVIIVHSYIDMPIVSDRDVISRCERVAAPEPGAYRFRWWATDQGPPPAPGVVRIEKSDGSWAFRPADGDATQTLARYESHTEVGGAVPAWLVNRLMLDTVVDGLETLRERVAEDRRARGLGPVGRAEARESVSKSR